MGIQDKLPPQAITTVSAMIDRGTTCGQQLSETAGYTRCFMPQSGQATSFSVNQGDLVLSLVHPPYTRDREQIEKSALSIVSCCMSLPVVSKMAVHLRELLKYMSDEAATPADRIHYKATFVRHMGGVLRVSGVSAGDWKPVANSQGRQISKEPGSIAIHPSGVFSMRVVGHCQAGDTLVAMVPNSKIENIQMPEFKFNDPVKAYTGFHHHEPNAGSMQHSKQVGLVIFALPPLPLVDATNPESAAIYDAVEDLRDAYFESGLVIGKSHGRPTNKAPFTSVAIGDCAIGVHNNRDHSRDCKRRRTRY